MNASQNKLNTHFAHVLFATLKQIGIDHIFMAPGSRSCPLSLAAHHYAQKFVTHFDERALAFMALGKIKIDKKPACVITTSGSAVGNLLPALMEAKAQNLPLILITADRPHELHHRGANQTLEQSGLFQQYTVFSTSFDAPSGSFNERALSSLISYVSVISQSGPVHLNIPLHEPLFDQACDFPHDVEFRKELSRPLNLDLSQKKGIIVLGDQACLSAEIAEFFQMLSEHLDAPIFADITSNFRSSGLNQVRYYPLYLDLVPLELDYILHFGKKITSKNLENFIKKFEGDYFHIDESSTLYDPYHKITATYRIPSRDWIEFLKTPKKHSNEFIGYWDEISEAVQARVYEFIEAYPSYEEAMYIRSLEALNSEEFQFFLGNSLPIRHMDSFFFPKKKSAAIFTQRGVSGIDGLIATACGISLNGKKTLALLGDLSTLYDVNSLHLIAKDKLPVSLVVFNNHGGGIFSYLPIAHQTPHFDKVMSTTHHLNFKDLAHGFDLDHLHISSLEEFESFLKNLPPDTLCEIVSDKSGNPRFLEAIKETLCSFLKELKKEPIQPSLSTAF